MTLPAAVANRNDDNNKKSTFSNPIELPSLETTEAVDRQKQQAFEALEIISYSTDGQYQQYVKCQCCFKNIRIVGRLQSPRGNRIDTLRKRISYLEERYRRGAFSAFFYCRWSTTTNQKSKRRTASPTS